MLLEKDCFINAAKLFRQIGANGMIAIKPGILLQELPVFRKTPAGRSLVTDHAGVMSALKAATGLIRSGGFTLS